MHSENSELPTVLLTKSKILSANSPALNIFNVSNTTELDNNAKFKELLGKFKFLNYETIENYNISKGSFYKIIL